MEISSAQAHFIRVVGAIAAIAGVAVLNVWLGFFAFSRKCGDEGFPPPPDGTARADYCNLFQSPYDNLTLLAGVVAYSPTVIVLGGVIWATAVGDWRIFRRSLALAAVVLAVVVLPTVLLPAG